MKEYSEIAPSESLENFIKYFWSYEHNEEDFEYIVLPDACFDLVVDYENRILQNIYLTGLWTKPQKIVVSKNTLLFAIRFKILAAEPFFQIKIKEILDSMIILPRNFWNIECLSNNDFKEFSSIISEHLNSILLNSKKIDQRKLILFDLIYNKKKYRVDELARRIFLSSRQINRYFNSQFGIPLKQFLNMVRCSESYLEIVKGNLYPSEEHADQAHFIKEIKKFTEETPRQLYKNENDRFIQLSYLKK